MADPRLLTAASKATRLLQSYGLGHPREIELEDIAWARNVRVRVGTLKGAEAHLVRVGETGTITTNSAIVEEGKRRFAIAHELGHWELHDGTSQVFFCSPADLREYRNSGPEIEANTFASELLIPRFMVDPAVFKADPSLDLIETLAAEFNVTLTSAAVRYAGISKHPVYVVFSDGERVRWWRRNDDKLAELWIEPGQQLSSESVASEVAAAPEHDTGFHPVPWNAWFHDSYSQEEVLEAAVRLRPYNTIVSLIWLPERY